MRKIRTRIAELTYDKDRILRVKLFDDAEIELEDAIQNYEATIAITQGEKFLVMVDATSNVSVSKEARAFVALTKENEKRIAEAFITTSVANKLVGNFYINFNKPKTPTKIFSSETDAIKWLESFLYLTESKNISHAPVFANLKQSFG